MAKLKAKLAKKGKVTKAVTKPRGITKHIPPAISAWLPPSALETKIGAKKGRAMVGVRRKSVKVQIKSAYKKKALQFLRQGNVGLAKRTYKKSIF